MGLRVPYDFEERAVQIKPSKIQPATPCAREISAVKLFLYHYLNTFDLIFSFLYLLSLYQLFICWRTTAVDHAACADFAKALLGCQIVQVINEFKVALLFRKRMRLLLVLILISG